MAAQCLKGWRPNAISDESGFGRVIVAKLEHAEDAMGEISNEDITIFIPDAARSVEFETTGGRGRLIKRQLKISMLRGICEGRLEQRRRYRARRITQTLQRTKNKNDGCHVLFVKKKEELRRIGKSGMKNWRDTQGKSIRMKK